MFIINEQNLPTIKGQHVLKYLIQFVGRDGLFEYNDTISIFDTKAAAEALLGNATECNRLLAQKRTDRANRRSAHIG